MLKLFFSYRSHQVALVLLLVLSLALTRVPLFNYLGYEFSALIALVGSLIAGLVTISLWKKSDAQKSQYILPFVARTLTICLAILLIPLVVMTLNALFVKNCSFTMGLILFVLLTAPAVLFCHALSLIVAVTISRWKKTVFVFAWIVVLLHIAYVTLGKPQIFAFNPIIGYFSGLTYDETLDILDRLSLYRLGTIALSVLIILAASALHHRRRADATPVSPNSLHLRQALAAALLLAVGALFFFSNRLGLSSSEGYIEQVLAGKAETEHFIISYPDTLLKGFRLQQVIELHEFYFDQLARILRVRPERKIHTFLYASQEQKGRLIGATGTDIAKPWLWQLHINLNDVDGALKHELVHVLAAEFGFPFLRVGVNSGLIEGLAVAVERIQYDEPVHRLASMAFASGLDPDVQSLFSLSGFMKAPAGVSYTLAGSFCRFLIDRYGMRRFKLLYRTGEFAVLYGRPLPVLLQEWRRFLSSFHFSESDLSKAEYLFKRRSIFGKECARVIANLNKETRDLLARRAYQEALESANTSLGHTMSVDAVFQKTTALLRLGRFPEAITFTTNVLRDSASASSFLTLKFLLGDALWGVDSLEGAMKEQAELLRSHLSMAWDESLALRLEILLKPELASDLKSCFLSATGDSLRAVYIEKMVSQHPKDGILRFLLARERISKDQFEEAVRLLDGIPKLKSPILELSRQRRLAQLSFALGRYEKAKIYYWQSLNYMFRESQGLEIEEKLHFCDWMERFGHGTD